MLVDAATLYFRAYYALPDSMTDGQGRPNNAIRGFFDGLRVLRDAHSPDRIVACWDDDWRPQWRVDLLPSYKTHRLADDGDEETPDTLEPQVPAIAELCEALGIPVIGAPEFEADDVIAALALTAKEPVIVVSGDRDLTQLVEDASGRRLAYLGTGVSKHTMFDEAAVREAYGVTPQQYADLIVLRGDPSDGIPGARGIGAKTAAIYLTAFGSLEGVLAAAETTTPPLTKAKADTLRAQADLLRASQRVVTLKAAPLTIPALKPDRERALSLANEYGVQRIIERW